MAISKVPPTKSIVVVSSRLPFAHGGAERLAEELVEHINKNGVRSELSFVPQNPFGKQLGAYLASRCSQFSYDSTGNKIDRIISLRYPAYAVKHPDHYVWLTHRMRDYYDLWDTFYTQLPTYVKKMKAQLRRFAIHTADSWLLRHSVKKVFTISRYVSEQLKYWGNISSEILYPPPPNRNYFCADYSNTILAVSRLHSLKRLDLFIRAFAHLKDTPLKGIIIGAGEQQESLLTLISQLDLANSVALLPNVSDDELPHHYAQALAVFFAPYHEDYGYVTLESFASAKPVVTCFDSGGPLEFVFDGVSGRICDPDPEAISKIFLWFMQHKNLAQEMGHEGRKIIQKISWDSIIQTLTTF